MPSTTHVFLIIFFAVYLIACVVVLCVENNLSFKKKIRKKEIAMKPTTIDILIEKIKQTGNPTVVGLDPRLDMIPSFIKEKAFSEHGNTPRGVSEAFLEFNKGLIDTLFDIVPAVKPQIAMYEQYGADGIDCYIKTIEYAKSKGMVIIGDVKRGDIASTAEAYSDGHIGTVDVGSGSVEIYKEDFITINPYLGGDSVEPYLENCKKYGKGLFTLVKTSNPESGDIQDIKTDDGKFIYEVVGELVNKWGADLIGESGFSQIGAVVGATHPEQAKRLREIMPNVFFLVPGYGAQGGKAEDLAVCFNEDGLGAVVNSSRGIIAAYKSDRFKCDEREFAEAARLAAIDMKADLARCI